ncbi:ATP-binding protein [Scrofimicrobium canadense]|nr:SbcC/MukB-like Walker B domain-containing protein [Scrofimicrobium canadense]
MTDQLFSTLELTESGGALTGYRLEKFEVFNWGTFDRYAWSIAPCGDNSLLTGEIGAGKSTLVDAITTLLLPAQKISYNKAAGAQTRERNLRSYVLGYYRSERSEETGFSHPVALRDNHSFSVILGVFRNRGFDEVVTLAQVFYYKDLSGQPERFYVTASQELSIESDFSGFGGDINDLRAALRKRGATIDKHFPDYGRKMRRLLGIRSEQAMDLFLQTVSMKSVGNLNEYVRGHMLEQVDAQPRINNVVSHFENLTKAHEAVQKATAQLELLTPLIGVCDKFQSAVGRRADLSFQRDAVGCFISESTLRVLESAAADSARRSQELEYSLHQLEASLAARKKDRDKLLSKRAGVGGDRLADLDAQIPHAKQHLDTVRMRRDRFNKLCAAAHLSQVGNDFTSEAFSSLISNANSQRSDLAAQEQSEQDALRPLVIGLGQVQHEVQALRERLDHLQRRRSNLPKELLHVRSMICDALDIDPGQLPFGAELMDVQPQAEQWRGAAERVLRGLALTMLVDEENYPSVSQWINSTHLGTRLVYLRARSPKVSATYSEQSAARLFSIIDVEPGPYESFIRQELWRRADHVLAESMAELRENPKAVTRQGLIKNGNRHEKDDRYRIDDPRKWLMMRGIERVLQALTADMEDLQARKAAAEKEEAERNRSLAELHSRLNALEALTQFDSWEEIDHLGASKRLEDLKSERQELIEGSSALATINQQIREVDAAIASLENDIQRLHADLTVLRHEHTRLVQRQEAEQQALSSVDASTLDRARTHYDSLLELLGNTLPATVEECDAQRTRLSNSLTQGIESAQNEINGLTTSIHRQMNEILSRWQELKQEMDADVGSIGDFRTFYLQVRNDDLPRYEEEFRTQLNTNALRELSSFNNWLSRQAEVMHERVARVNEALAAIDYNPGRHITLVTQPTVNQEIRQFRADLKEATSDVLTPDDANNESRFDKVRALIERLRGRPEHAESDRTWASRVTDVRNWYSFAASEIDRYTGVEHEHYTDSDGKSGGQKEKLAYTILAASLAYQFGLEWGVSKSKDFRFAVIDEAFGRGSEASTRYALELFSKLGLQLLIVTPLQKVNVIAPYVKTIGFVDSPSGDYSRVHTLTIEEFHRRSSARQALESESHRV